MFEDDVEEISDDDIENILETDEGESKGDKAVERVVEKAAAPAVVKQPSKVDALDIAWESLRGEKEESVEIQEKPEGTFGRIEYIFSGPTKAVVLIGSAFYAIFFDLFSTCCSPGRLRRFHLRLIAI